MANLVSPYGASLPSLQPMPDTQQTLDQGVVYTAGSCTIHDKIGGGLVRIEYSKGKDGKDYFKPFVNGESLRKPYSIRCLVDFQLKEEFQFCSCQDITFEMAPGNEYIIVTTTVNGPESAWSWYVDITNPIMLNHSSDELYPNKLKNWEFSEAEQARFDSEKTGPLLNIGAVFSGSKMACSAKEKTNSSACLGIYGYNIYPYMPKPITKEYVLSQVAEIPTLWSSDPSRIEVFYNSHGFAVITTKVDDSYLIHYAAPFGAPFGLVSVNEYRAESAAGSTRACWIDTNSCIATCARSVFETQLNADTADYLRWDKGEEPLTLHDTHGEKVSLHGLSGKSFPPRLPKLTRSKAATDRDRLIKTAQNRIVAENLQEKLEKVTRRLEDPSISKADWAKLIAEQLSIEKQITDLLLHEF
jgi:hypothetical protein